MEERKGREVEWLRRGRGQACLERAWEEGGGGAAEPGPPAAKLGGANKLRAPHYSLISPRNLNAVKTHSSCRQEGRGGRGRGGRGRGQ